MTPMDTSKPQLGHFGAPSNLVAHMSHLSSVDASEALSLMEKVFQVPLINPMAADDNSSASDPLLVLRSKSA